MHIEVLSAMNIEKLLGGFANVAAILTPLVAVLAYSRFLWERRQKRLRLESYLREQKLFECTGQHSFLHLVATLGMFEADIMDASYRSKVISRNVAVDVAGEPVRIVLEYEPDDLEKELPKRPGRGQF
ncbi:hypothetical protein [Sinorhizobium fredii]|uniref:hypothetical protein n=1 Tax=Rhizobium fredii TaxID=380 RepID=UPI001F0B56E6|nr:hypothetical protein [Sinorhizobium fredii]